MLRPSLPGTTRRPSLSIVVPNDSAENNLLEFTGVPRKFSDDPMFDPREYGTEAADTNVAYLWLLLLSTLAECITSCFLPEWYYPGWNVNVTATLINFIGPFLDGMSYGYEDHLRMEVVRIPALQFRAAFFGYAHKFTFLMDY